MIDILEEVSMFSNTQLIGSLAPAILCQPTFVMYHPIQLYTSMLKLINENFKHSFSLLHTVTTQLKYTVLIIYYFYEKYFSVYYPIIKHYTPQLILIT